MMVITDRRARSANLYWHKRDPAHVNNRLIKRAFAFTAAVAANHALNQTPCRGNITRSTMFTVFENAMGAVTPHLTLVRSNRLEEGFLADRTEVGGYGAPAPIRNGFRVGPF